MCDSAQDDATVKCWGRNANGNLGYGDTLDRGDDKSGGCPARPTPRPAPHTLHPTTYTYTLHPTPCTLHPAPYTNTLHSRLWV
jgi:hypothetical protein